MIVPKIAKLSNFSSLLIVFQTAQLFLLKTLNLYRFRVMIPKMRNKLVWGVKSAPMVKKRMKIAMKKTVRRVTNKKCARKDSFLYYTLRMK